MSDYTDIDTALMRATVALVQGSPFVNITSGRVLPAATVMGPKDNIILIVDSNQGKVNFQVNSSMPCIASPVFRTMLHSNSQFRETISALQTPTLSRISEWEAEDIDVGKDHAGIVGGGRH